MSRSVQTPSKAFAFPNEWQPVRLGSIGKTYGGLTGKSGEDFNTGSASYVTFMQVMGNSRLREPAKGTVNINPGERQNHVQKDDLLFNGSSETPEEVALAAAVDFHPDSDTFLNSFCFGFRLLPDAPADSLFLAYLFRSSVGRNLVSSLAQGATRYNISKTQLLNQAIHLPPKAEQIAIREKLTDAEELINSLERLISKKQAIKQGMMQELLTGRTRLPGFIKDWTRLIAGELGVFKGGIGFPVWAQGGKSGAYPFFKVSDMNLPGNETVMKTSNNWVSENIRRRLAATALPAGAIVFAKVGAAVYLERKRILGIPSCVDNNMAAFIPDSTQIDNRFAYYYLLSFPLSSLVAMGALPSLNSSQLRSIPFHFPEDIEEQKAIAQILQDADQEIATLERRLESARNIKQGMMQELLTGRTRLPVEEVSS